VQASIIQSEQQQIESSGVDRGEITTTQNNETETIAQSQIQSEVKNQDNKYYQVTKVVDGDTIAVNLEGKSETIRLIGINTPETVDPRKPVECFGIEASNKAKELLSGQQVSLESDASQDDRDKYGRLLRYIKTQNGLFYNLEIIKQGYAYEYTYNVPYKYRNEFKAAENYARTNKLGLWADGACGQSNIDNSSAIPVAPKATNDDTPARSAPAPTQCECSSNLYNCGDFKTQAEAQTLFECCGGTGHDIHRLDSDKDGKVCESLP
jgi:endonuclease YncB( thermonuclease family)